MFMSPEATVSISILVSPPLCLFIPSFPHSFMAYISSSCMRQVEMSFREDDCRAAKHRKLCDLSPGTQVLCIPCAAPLGFQRSATCPLNGIGKTKRVLASGVSERLTLLAELRN